MRERFGALVEEEKGLTLLVESPVTWETDVDELARASARLPFVRQVLAAFPEGVTPPPRALSASDRARVDWLVRQNEARAFQIRRLESEIPPLEQKLTETPTPRELAAWANNSGDPRELHFRLVRQRIEAKRVEIEELREASRLAAEEIQRTHGQENSDA